MRSLSLAFGIILALLFSACGAKVVEVDNRIHNSWPVIENDSLLSDLSKYYMVSLSTKDYPANSDSLIRVSTFIINPESDSARNTFSDVTLQVYEYRSFHFANTSFELKCEELAQISGREYDENDPYHPGTTAYPNYYFLSGKHIYLLSGTYSAGETAMEEIFHAVKEIVSRGHNFESRTIVKLRHTGDIEIN